MNWILALACFGATLAIACGKKCQSAEECEEGQCCLAATTFQLETKGNCIRLGRKNSRCSHPESKMENFGGKFLTYCPCQEGFTCQSKLSKNDTDIAKYRFSLRCQSDSTTPKPEVTVPEDVTTEGDKGTSEGTGDEGTGDDGTGDDGTGDEGTGDEGTGDEGTAEGNADNPEEIREGPGGEPPRDDDCLDWEYPC